MTNKNFQFLFSLILITFFLGTGFAIYSNLNISQNNRTNAQEKVLASTDSNKPIVGAIRYDAWLLDSNLGELSSDKWSYRRPFFSYFDQNQKLQIVEDKQEIIDREIKLAKSAGLSYWAFDMASCQPLSSKFNYGLNLYLSSKYKSNLNFSLILLPSKGVLSDINWRTIAVPKIVKLVQEPTFQKVLGNRPLIYIYGMDDYITKLGDKTFKEDILFLREEIKKTGIANPYLVAMGAGEKYNLREYGINAISAYSTPSSGEPKELPYSALAKNNQDSWNWWKSLGKQVVPIVNGGWDFRPLLKPFGDRDPNIWFKKATLEEFEDNLKSAINWINENPSFSESKAIIIYAWNEIGEGSWLLPTAEEKDFKLQTIAKVLGNNYYAPSIKSGGISGSSNPWKVWFIGENFSNNLTIELFDKNQQKWGDNVTPVFSEERQSINFSLPSNSPPSNCNLNKPCLISGFITDKITQKSTSFTIKLGPINSSQSPEIINSGINESSQIWVIGNNFSPSLKVRLFDKNGIKFPEDLPVGTSTELKFLSFSIPANNPGFACDSNNENCQISFKLINPITNIGSTRFSVTLPSY